MNLLIKNKKAYHEYEIFKKIEAGILLNGDEVKSIRKKNFNIIGSYIKITNNEIYVHNLTINQYSNSGNFNNYDSKRTRKLLIKKKEILKIISIIKEKKITLTPLEIYIKENKIKITIGLTKIKTKINKKKELVEKEIKKKNKKLFF